MSSALNPPLRLRSPRTSSDAEHGVERQPQRPVQLAPLPEAGGDDQHAAAPEPPKGLRRLGSALWGSESKLLRHSSITVFEPTGERGRLTEDVPPRRRFQHVTSPASTTPQPLARH